MINKFLYDLTTFYFIYINLYTNHKNLIIADVFIHNFKIKIHTVKNKHRTGEKELRKKVKTENSPARDMSPERMFPGLTRGKG